MLVFFSSRRRHTRYIGDWSSDVCSSDLPGPGQREKPMRLREFIAAVAVAAPVAALAAACDAPEHRQFDFWLGEWSVHTADGKLAGTNRITREYDGCVLHEHYATPRTYSGESLNMYDAGR